jgi:serine protease inhibitor
MHRVRLIAAVFLCAAVHVSAATVTPGNTAFAFDLYARLKEQPGNLFLSPYSISAALAMTYGGARSATEAQMAKALHFDLPQADIHLAFAGLQNALNAMEAKGTAKLAVANSLWPQKGYDFLPAYLDLCKTQYGTAVTPVDFAGATEAARKTINGWVEEKTSNKIQEMFKPGVLDPMTRLVLVNAIYFKGTWLTQFDKNRTHDEPFHLAADRQATAPLMFVERKFRYSETPELQVIELAYAGNDLSMLVLLPRRADGLAALEQTLTAENYGAWTKGLRSRKARVWLPRFRTASEFSLNRTLAALGITDAFSPAADFSGMDGKKDLFIGAVVHKAFVDVGEEGTEAAAATGVAMMLKSAPMHDEPPVVFRADHPFLFAIRENATGGILFLGRIVDPTK